MRNNKIKLLLLSTLLFPSLIALASCDNGGEQHVHVYDKMVATDTYLCRKATCTHAAKYYYSCECGKMGKKKFDYGEPSDHNYEVIIEGNYKSAYLVGETFDTTGMTASLVCSGCGDEGTIAGSIVPGNTSPLEETEGVGQMTLNVGEHSTVIPYTAKKYIVTDIALNAVNQKVTYEVTGKYADGFDIDNFFVSISHSSDLYWSNDLSSSNFEVISLDKSQKTFKMAVDVTNITAGEVYYPNFYGKQYNSSNGAARMIDYSGNFNNVSATLGNMTFSLSQGNDGVLSLKKSLNLTGASFEATHVSLDANADGKLYYVVSGTSEGYSNAAELTSDILFQFKVSGSTKIIQDNMVKPITFNSGNGNFEFKFDVSSLPTTTNPYYTRLGTSKTGLKDFNTVERTGVDTDPVSYNNKGYAIVYNGSASSAASAYGTIGLQVGTSTFKVNSVKLEKDSSADKAYLVIGGLASGYDSKEALKAEVSFSIASTNEINVTSYDVASGAFTFKLDITSAAVSPYLHVAKMALSGASLSDFNSVELSKVDLTTKVTAAGKDFTLKYFPGSNLQEEGFGAVSLLVEMSRDTAPFKPTSVYLTSANNKAYYIIEGTTYGYDTKEALVSDFSFKMKNRIGGYATVCIQEGNSQINFSSFDSQTGAFKIEIDISGLDTNTNPYYTRIGVKSIGEGDFNTVDNANVNKTPLTVGTKTYTLVFEKGSSSAAKAYGTIGLMIASA